MNQEKMEAEVMQTIGAGNFKERFDSVSVSDGGSVVFLSYGNIDRLVNAIERLTEKLNYKLRGGIQPAFMESKRTEQQYCAALTRPIINPQPE
jgi:hypothetical protein